MTNLDHLSLLNIIRCMILQMASDNIEVISFRAKNGKGVIEIKPDERVLATGQKSGFSYYTENSVSVIWREQK